MIVDSSSGTTVRAAVHSSPLLRRGRSSLKGIARVDCLLMLSTAARYTLRDEPPGTFCAGGSSPTRWAASGRLKRYSLNGVVRRDSDVG
jgi:hypothetical protein